MEIRRSYDRLISTMGFPILVRLHLYIESGPWSTDVASNHRNPENLKRRCVYNFIIRTMTADGLTTLPLGARTSACTVMGRVGSHIHHIYIYIYIYIYTGPTFTRSVRHCGVWDKLNYLCYKNNSYHDSIIDGRHPQQVNRCLLKI